MKNIKYFLSLAIIIFMVSCSGSPDNTGADVIVSLGNRNVSTSTLLPDTIPEIGTYTVSLAEVIYKDGEWQLSDSKEKRIESFPGNTDEFRFENVRLGRYTVSIQAMDEKALPVLNGSGTENLAVTASGTNTVTVELAPISDNTYTGSASMTFDWSDLALSNETVQDAMEKGGLVFILYRFDETESRWVEAGRSEATGEEATRLEFVVDVLPVSTGLRLKYALATADGVMLNPVLTTPIAQIYANLTSVQDVNGKKVYSISANEISNATNVYDVEWTYGPEEGSSVTLSWKNQKYGSDILFDYVTVKYSSVAGKTHEENVAVTSEKSSYTISDMTMGDEYTVSFQAHHKSGLVSPVYTYPEKISAEVLLDAPTALKAEAGTDSIIISWSAVTGAESYIVYRSINGGEFEELSDAGNTTSFADSDLYASNEYAYAVIAVRGEVRSEMSEETEPLRIAESVIVITTTKPDSNFVISISEQEKMVITPEISELAVSVAPIDGVTAYTWYINGVEAKSGSAENGGTFIKITKESDGVRTDLENGLNSLMLAVTTADGTFSSEVKFAVVSVLDEGVNISLPGDIARLSTKLESGEERTIKLDAKVYPDNATLQSIAYESDNEEIAVVDSTGLVTLKGGTGKVTITASPSYGESAEIVLDIYEATFKSAEEIVNAINKELGKHVSGANQKFEGDWWPGEFADEYTATGVKIETSTGASQSAGYIEFSSYTAETEIGNISINGKLMVYADNPDGWGYLGTEPIKTIGYGSDSNTLTVTLPGNQGSVDIKYNSVNVIDRGGSYTLSFSDTVGYEEGEFHGGNPVVADSSSLAAIL